MNALLKTRTHRSARLPRLLDPAAKAALGLLTLLLAPIAAPASAGVPGSGPTRGFVIHTPDQVLRDFCRSRDGGLWLELPGGASYELVTSTADPAIANPGDGAFHPYDLAVVQAVLAAVTFPLESVRAEIYLLPYPRRSGLESAAGPGLILLAPGVRPLSTGHQHTELVHELGHVVQYALMPDQDTERWNAYRRLRGIEDRVTYSASSPHRNRPHEIFAEDFRVLFGGALAAASGAIENSSLTAPRQVPGLEQFMLGLGGAAPIVRLAATPNPSRGAVRFSAPGGADRLDLYDAAGRRLATLESATGEWWWDGRDAAGRPVPGGVVFARVRGRSEPAVRITLIR